MHRRIAVVLAVVLAAVMMLAWSAMAADTEKVTGKVTLDKAAYKPGETVKAVIKLSVAPGFHVNADAEQEPAGAPCQVAVAEGGVVTLGAVGFPKAKKANLAFSEKPAPVFEGEVEIVAELKVAAGAAKGPHKGSLVLTYQGCNDQMCFMPVDLSLPFEFAVE